MKRKTIIKFVSLLGVGSFVMLAAASCTQALSLIPNSSSTSTNPNPTSNSRDMANTTPNQNPTTPPTSGAEMNNPSSGGTTETNNVDQQLSSARKTLTDLLDNESKNLALYSDYANIESTLKSAYDTAKTASQNNDASLDELKSITATLQSAIKQAESDKQAFDSANQGLVTAYKELKTALQSKTTTLNGLSEERYSRIKELVDDAYKNINDGIISKPLDSFMSTDKEAQDLINTNKELQEVLTKLPGWKSNAERFDNFEEKLLSQAELTKGASSTTTQPQPPEWSFAGYSVSLNGASNLENLGFTQRKVWVNNNGTTSPVATPESTTDVSWVYGLRGTGDKYTFKFTYYGPSTAYLYFPYKRYKTNDQTALQYKLNDATQATVINFGDGVDVNGPTPTVPDIYVAKITLTNLNFGENTIEFSIPTGQNRFAPMIGNMYLTSNFQSQPRIHDKIFGNTKTNNTSVTVDLLKGYGLAAGWSTYIGEFKDLFDSTGPSGSKISTPSYLVGFIGGTGDRGLDTSISSPAKQPRRDRLNRTLTIYVNAPSPGEYHISGSYISDTSQRSLTFQANGDTTKSVTISVTSATGFTTLERFDTSNTNDTANTNRSRVLNNGNRSLTLKQGLNKIILSGNDNTPFIGNLTFTLNSAS
ncbi:hypothetical protein H3143_02065 [Mycoplasma tullyi]|uniref:Haemagglutinin Mycoplasma domain-containing protein n=1 Tax=Mycoplasma tullyi TaxID=1612150 RepID=A0A7D7U2B1_9MOLU|nr:hypothetical protein [Mycoplasma tullyi]QMT98271.1 hypothetical protein H3143_02065 [Mycoplasma tullyi]